MISAHKLIFSVSILLLTSIACSAYANNSVSVTFVNQVAAFDNSKSNPMFSIGAIQTIISNSSFSLQDNTIAMPYSGDAQLLAPGVNYYDANGPAGAGYYQLSCLNPTESDFETMIDTRYGGSATITILNLTTQPTLELTCSCFGTACGTSVRK